VVIYTPHAPPPPPQTRLCARSRLLSQTLTHKHEHPLTHRFHLRPRHNWGCICLRARRFTLSAVSQFRTEHPLRQASCIRRGKSVLTSSEHSASTSRRPLLGPILPLMDYPPMLTTCSCVHVVAARCIGTHTDASQRAKHQRGPMHGRAWALAKRAAKVRQVASVSQLGDEYGQLKIPAVRWSRLYLACAPGSSPRRPMQCSRVGNLRSVTRHMHKASGPLIRTTKQSTVVPRICERPAPPSGAPKRPSQGGLVGQRGAQKGGSLPPPRS